MEDGSGGSIAGAVRGAGLPSRVGNSGDAAAELEARLGEMGGREGDWIGPCGCGACGG